MRHRKAGRKFKRSPSHRRMMLRNLATALIEHGRIETTLAKAKELQPYVEKIITLAKDGWDLNSFRRVLAVADQQEGRLRPVPRDRPPVQGPARRLHPDLQARQGPPGRRRADGRHLPARRRRAGQGPAPGPAVVAAPERPETRSIDPQMTQMTQRIWNLSFQSSSVICVICG